jgi:hypothetical protein
MVWLLRRELKASFNFLSKLKVGAGGMEVEFNRELEKVKEETSSQLLHPETATAPLPSLIDNQILSLAEQSPRAAVMEAWRHVEAAALLAAKNLVRDEKFNARTMTFRAIQIIERAGIVPDTIVDAMRRLRSLRNDAAHSAV